jgi:hypothetical protein
MKLRNFAINQFKYFNLKLLFLSIGLSLITSVILLPGCNKEKGEYLLGDLKNQNPYSGDETIIFLDNQGDSIIFYGDGRSSYLFESPTSANKRYYYINERDECNFTEKNKNFRFSINLTTRNETGALMDILLTKIDNVNNGECSNINNGGYRLPLFENYRDTKLFMDSLMVLDKYYYHVIADSGLLAKVSGVCDTWNKVKCLYYTTSEGIIKLEFENGNTWQLKNIEW